LVWSNRPENSYRYAAASSFVLKLDAPRRYDATDCGAATGSTSSVSPVTFLTRTREPFGIASPFALDPMSEAFWADGIKTSLEASIEEAEELSNAIGIS